MSGPGEYRLDHSNTCSYLLYSGMARCNCHVNNSPMLEQGPTNENMAYRPVKCPNCKTTRHYKEDYNACVKDHSIQCAFIMTGFRSTPADNCDCAGSWVDKETKATFRTFATGANRDTDEGKLDFEGFINPLVLKRYAEYMHKNRTLRDGSIRDSDNWQKGMPKDVLIKSGHRHFMDWWLIHRGYNGRESIEEALCGLMFNVQAYLLAVLKDRDCAQTQNPKDL